VDRVPFVASIRDSSVSCATSGCIFYQQQGKQRDTVDFSSGTMKHTSDWE
jgi:hypothetical protein